MKRRLIIAGLGAVGVLLASATPAHAVAVNQFTDARAMSVTVSDCAPTAALGSKCRGFILEASLVKTQDGVVNKVIGVEGYDLTVIGAGGVALGPKVSAGSTGTGTISISTDARTGSLKFTVALTCDSGPCPVEGSFKISVSARKSSLSSYSKSGGSSYTEGLPSCTSESGGFGAGLDKPAAKGTVKLGGSTKVLRSAPSSDGSISRSYNYTKVKGICP